MRGCLIQVSPLDPATQTRIVLRAGASLNSRTLKADGLLWRSCVSRLPRIQFDFFDVNFNGAVQTAKATLTLNARRIPDYTRDYLNTLIWVGAPIIIWSGDGQATADLNLAFTGLVIAGVIDRATGSLPLQCEVERQLLDVPLLNIEFTGGGGVNGDPEVKGQLRPACFGSPVNVEPIFFDQVNWIGQVDGYGNLTALNTLYEDAASFGAKAADYATYAALLAAVIPEGSWATCVAAGLVRLGANPKGVITCDPVAGGGTPGVMMLRWLQNHAGVSAGKINSTSFTDLDTSLTTLLGHAPAVSYFAGSQRGVLDCIQAMCAACNASPFIGPDGKVTVSRAINPGAAAMTLNRKGGKPLVTDWRSLDTPDPWWRLKAEAAKTWRVHGLNEIDYEDDLVPMGDYDNAETYRQGMIVRNPMDGIAYIFINAVPSSGHVPPNAVYWDVYEEAPDASVVRYADGRPVQDLEPAVPGATFNDNLVPNGTLARDAYRWSTVIAGTNDGVIAPATRVVGVAGDPAPAYFRLAATAGGNQLVSLYAIGPLGVTTIPLEEGVANYYLSGFGRRSSGPINQFVIVAWVNADNTAELANVAYDLNPSAANAWEGREYTITPPPGAAFARVYASLNSTGMGQTGNYDLAGIRLSRTQRGANAGTVVGYGRLGTGTLSIVGNTITRTDAGGAWNTNFISGDSFVDSVYVAGLLPTTDTMIGLTDTNTISGPNAAQSYFELDYAWDRDSGGGTLIWESGSLALNCGAALNGVNFAATTRFAIVYSGLFVRYYADGVLMRTANTTGGRKFRASGALLAVNKRVAELTFGPALLTPDLNSNIIDSGGGYSVVPRTATITALGQAASIAGQAAAATDATIEPSATVDADILVDNPIIIYADSAGVPKAGEINKVVTAKLRRLGADITSGMTWGATLLTGTATFTISGTGTATFTITGPNSAALSLESTIRLTGSKTGIERSTVVKVLRIDDPPTNSGGGGGNPGTSASTTTLGNATSTAYGTGESAILKCKAGTAGQVACTWPLNYKRTPGTVDGVTGALGKWQWRVVGGSFADITTEIASGSNASTITNAGDPAVNLAGNLNVSMTKTGLTSGTDYEFKFLWRKNDVSGDVDDIYRSSGTGQAAGS